MLQKETQCFNAENAEKPKNVWDLKIFFWRTAGSFTVQDKQGTHEQLSLNPKKKQLWIIQLTTKNEAYVNFWTWSFYKFSYYFHLWTIQYVHVFYVKYIIQVSTKYKITCVLYDPSYFGKIFLYVNFWPQLYIQ